MNHRCEVFGLVHDTPHSAMCVMVIALNRAIDRMQYVGVVPEGVVVPAVGWRIAAVWAASDAPGISPVVRVVEHGESPVFTVHGLPIFFAGADANVEPFAISRVAHKGGAA